MNGGLSHGVVQIDPQDTQREEAASQRILAETSEHLIDVLALQTPMTDSTISPGVDSTSNAKQERYQALLQQVLSAELTFKSRQNGINSSGDLPDEYVSTLKTIRRDHVGPLVAGWQGGSMSIDEVTG
ncbi:MAG: hypothetical protein M1816_007495 [Peltula sp. TS41687]|nr:MAG: hypothetical protein M1816_007495 [Peltula sp. TS41687]